MVNLILLQARALENQIDAKLIALSKLGTSLKTPTSSDFGSLRTPLLAAEERHDDESVTSSFVSMAEELDNLLSRLSSVNTSLSDWTDRHPSNAAIQHTLQRHRHILKDYRQEYQQTKTNISALVKRHELLGDGEHGGKNGDLSSNVRMDLLLKESEHARNSDRLIDDQINIAIEARDTLVNQRLAFKAIQTKLNDISNRFPMINNLVQKINLRKRRDAIIVAIVLGLCLTFLLWWTMS
jgi:Golgi SNAP receptor complex protein 1